MRYRLLLLPAIVLQGFPVLLHIQPGLFLFCTDRKCLPQFLPSVQPGICFLLLHKVQAYHNGKFVTVTNEDLKGKWAIFFFYPADFTFVCPTELVDMVDKYDRFKAMGVEIYSVSTDTHFVHKAWHDTSESIRKINYPMLADPTGVLSRGFGVMIEEEGVAYRGTFVVNPEGKVKLVEIQDNSIGRNADELLRKVAAAQFVEAHPGEVCPAKWQQGAETLKPSIDLVGKI